MDKEPSTSVIRYQAREPGQNSCPPGNDTIENASPSWGSQGASTTTREITTRLHPFLTCPVTLHLLQGSHIVLKITKLKRSPTYMGDNNKAQGRSTQSAVKWKKLSCELPETAKQKYNAHTERNITLNFLRLML